MLGIFPEAREAIPDETWDALPPDLATQHDHYISGTPIWHAEASGMRYLFANAFYWIALLHEGD